MQKKLIALAVAGLASGAAFADSANVTMYGVADGSFEQVSISGVTANGVGAANTALNYASRGRVNSNNSLIGFKGAESLGNGLTAVFQFESNVDLHNATGLLGGKRDTLIGLAGPFGTVAAGYLSTPARSLMVQFDVMPGATGAGGINSIMGHVNAGAAVAPLSTLAAGINTGNTMNNTGHNQNLIFRTNAIAYISPNFNGFTGVLAYVPDSGKDNIAGVTGPVGPAVVNAVERKPTAWNFSLTYANGPIKAGYSYLKASDMPVLGAAGIAVGATGYSGAESNTYHLLGGSYDFGNGLLITGMYDKVNVSLGTNAAAVATTFNSLSRSGWYLGAKYVMGPNEFAANYAKVGDNSIACVGACLATSDFSQSGAKQFSLRYGYNFSKRTQVYGLYTRVTNDANGNFDVFNGSGGAAATAAASIRAGGDPQVVGLGMRHTF